MLNSLRKWFFERFELHPFLFSIWPILYLYVNNIDQVKEEVLLIPIIASLTLFLIVFFLLKILVKNSKQTALLVSVFILFFFFYYRITHVVSKYLLSKINLWIGVDTLAIILFIVFAFFIYFFILPKKKLLDKGTDFFNVVSIILILISLFNIFKFEVDSQRYVKAANFKLTVNEVKKPDISNPDVYYLIFDRYSGQQTTKLYEFDNSQFFDELKRRGFYIADKANSNYPSTNLSLASSLNYEYLNSLTEQTNGGSTTDTTLANLKIENNLVVKTFKEQGYKYYHLGSWWVATKTNINADKNYLYKYFDVLYLDEFSTKVLEDSLGGKILKSASLAFDGYTDHRNKADFQLNQISGVSRQAGPKFVFVHVLLPHPPYVFDSNCGALKESDTARKSEKENYLDQLQCTNRKILGLVDNIFANSKTKPIILLQADEGTFPILFPLGESLWVGASQKSIKEKFPILNAYYFPDDKKISEKYQKLYPSISPVNSFRVVFEQYFGKSLPLLPDRSFVNEPNGIYKFTDVTEILQEPEN